MVEQEQKDENKKDISFKLPSSKSEVLDIQFLQDDSRDNAKESHSENEDLIQIIAMDYENKVLVIATWNVANDQEVSMHQIVCENDYPLSIFLRGIVTKKEIKRGEETLEFVKGSNNYLL